MKERNTREDRIPLELDRMHTERRESQETKSSEVSDSQEKRELNLLMQQSTSHVADDASVTDANQINLISSGSDDEMAVVSRGGARGRGRGRGRGRAKTVLSADSSGTTSSRRARGGRRGRGSGGGRGATNVDRNIVEAMAASQTKGSVSRRATSAVTSELESMMLEESDDGFGALATRRTAHREQIESSSDEEWSSFSSKRRH